MFQADALCGRCWRCGSRINSSYCYNVESKAYSNISTTFRIFVPCRRLFSSEKRIRHPPNDTEEDEEEHYDEQTDLNKKMDEFFQELDYQQQKLKKDAEWVEKTPEWTAYDKETKITIAYLTEKWHKSSEPVSAHSVAKLHGQIKSAVKALRGKHAELGRIKLKEWEKELEEEQKEMALEKEKSERAMLEEGQKQKEREAKMEEVAVRVRKKQ